MSYLAAFRYQLVMFIKKNFEIGSDFTVTSKSLLWHRSPREITETGHELLAVVKTWECFHKFFYGLNAPNG